MSPPVSAPLPSEVATRARRRRSPISLTPLIDVVFILLVFFMLASSFLDWRAIALDAPGKAAAGSSMEGALLVEVRPDGPRLSGEAIGLEALAARIGQRIAEEPDQRVLIKPAAGVSLQDAVAVIDRLSAAGARDLSLIRDAER